MSRHGVLAELRAEEHVSFSAISTYMRCPQKWKFIYDLKAKPTHRPANMAFGSAMHSVLAEFYSALKDGESEPSKEKLQRTFSDVWRQQLEGPTPVLFDEKDSAEILKEKGTGLIEVFLDQAPRPHKVVGVEEPFGIEVFDPDTGEVLQKRLVGVFDAVAQDEDGGYRILEHKTAARRWTEDKLANDLQITAYRMAAPLMGLGEAGITVQLLLKTKEPAFETYNLTRTEQDIKDLLLVIAGVLKSIKASAFYPVRDWQCQSCQFAGPCMAG